MIGYPVPAITRSRSRVEVGDMVGVGGVTSMYVYGERSDRTIPLSSQTTTVRQGVGDR